MGMAATMAAESEMQAQSEQMQLFNQQLTMQNDEFTAQIKFANNCAENIKESVGQ
jgi:hypothetical protein